MGQHTQSDVALKRSVLSQAPQLSCRDSYGHLQGPEERAVLVQHMEGDAGTVIAVQPPPSGGRSRQFSIITWLYTRCLPAKPRDMVPHHQQEALRRKAVKIQAMPPVIRQLGSLQCLGTRPLL